MTSQFLSAEKSELCATYGKGRPHTECTANHGQSALGIGAWEAGKPFRNSTNGRVPYGLRKRELLLFENLNPLYRTVLIFFVAGSPLRLERVVSLGAYRVRLEAGLRIPSD
jgi:hypothetical protein